MNYNYRIRSINREWTLSAEELLTLFPENRESMMKVFKKASS